MKLYNTLTRNLDIVAPLNPPTVSIYTCGPTVYDHAHVGHWFNYVRMDTLIRALKTSNLDTNWVMNITDVGHLVSDADDGEDKLEKGAQREGKTAWEVAEFYTQDFLDGMQQLNILTPNHIVKATDHIQEQIELIQQLEEKGYTYIISDGVYYDTSKFEGYAAFARLDLDDQEAGARIGINPEKRQPSDFALWKFSPSDRKRDMEWDSPWGKGFPGWHIECSAMSMKYLGDSIDIHTGGIDHIQVHHTNEIAQSEAVTGKRFAQHWMHSNHVMVAGEKISKSLGNGIRLSEIAERGISPLAVRLNVLESHYRSQSRFSWDGLEAAQNRLRDYRAMAALKWQSSNKVNDAMSFTLVDVPTELAAALQNDLDTPKALAYLSYVSQQIQQTLIHSSLLVHFVAMLEAIDELLGLKLSIEPDITDVQKERITQRETARAEKDWATSDEIRDELLEQGIVLRDTEIGTIWHRQ